MNHSALTLPNGLTNFSAYFHDFKRTAQILWGYIQRCEIKTIKPTLRSVVEKGAIFIPGIIEGFAGTLHVHPDMRCYINKHFFDNKLKMRGYNDRLIKKYISSSN